MKNIVVYSHGFGVRKDDRGLFTDIAAGLPDSEHVLFDYNQFDDTTLTVAPLHTQAEMLICKIDEVKKRNPDASIDLICHSQGCVVAALAKNPRVRKAIFLAPPETFKTVEEKIRQMSERVGTIVEKDGEIRYPRRDGSTTIVKADYWESYAKIQPRECYSQFAEMTDLTIIVAKQDEVLGATDFAWLADKAQIVAQDASHDFTGTARHEVIRTVKTLL